MVRFIEEGHSYLDKDNNKLISATTIIHALHEEFDKESTAKKSSKNAKSKWYGMPPEDIITAWHNESERAASLGTWYHALREQNLYTLPNVVMPNIVDGVKHALSQKLENGKIYPEFLCYLLSAGICGQIDYLEVRDNKVIIRDYKTSKKIDMHGYTNWEGITKMMLGPVAHLDDCEFSKYSIQLSLYMYIILRHNPMLEPGDMTIEHVSFVQAGEDQHGYPVYATNEFGDYIVKEIKEIPVPYLKTEVMNILTWMKNNTKKLKK
jgi:hypothetical protein